jgi:ribosomal protein S18 acetylase RimI-like enzyme
LRYIKNGLPDRFPFKEAWMKIRPLIEKDRTRLISMLRESRAFTLEEIEVASELIDIVLKDQNQKDYTVRCIVDDQDQPVGYICYGPTPMTQGTFDLYWIVVDPDHQGKGIGSKLLGFLENVVIEKGGRMILADTSTIPQYEKTQKFYLQNGFRETARVADYYYPGNDRITFCKRIA